MSFSSKPLDGIVKQDLVELITNKIPESRYLDYKRELPGNTWDDKKEFLSDVSSFANAAGGSLIYGIDAPDGIPLTLAPLSIKNLEAVVNRLDSLIRDGIAPRIHGIEIQDVEISTSSYVIILKIPRSWNSPHVVDYKNRFRFYSRSSKGRHPLDVHELRNAFVISESASDKVKDFRRNRIEEISAAITPVSLAKGAKLIVHVVPLDAFALGNKLDIQRVVDEQDVLNIMGYAYRHNFDGYLAYSPVISDSAYLSTAYTQVFRNGCIEFVKVLETIKEEKYIALSGTDIDRFILISVESHLDLLKRLGVGLPVYIMVSLLGAHRCEIVITVDDPPFRRRVIRTPIHPSIPHEIDRSTLLVSPITIENYEVELKSILRVVFDTIWNAAGHEKSYSYEE